MTGSHPLWHIRRISTAISPLEASTSSRMDAALYRSLSKPSSLSPPSPRFTQEHCIQRLKGSRMRNHDIRVETLPGLADFSFDVLFCMHACSFATIVLQTSSRRCLGRPRSWLRRRLSTSLYLFRRFNCSSSAYQLLQFGSVTLLARSLASSFAALQTLMPS